MCRYWVRISVRSWSAQFCPSFWRWWCSYGRALRPVATPHCLQRLAATLWQTLASACQQGPSTASWCPCARPLVAAARLSVVIGPTCTVLFFTTCNCARMQRTMTVLQTAAHHQHRSVLLVRGIFCSRSLSVSPMSVMIYLADGFNFVSTQCCMVCCSMHAGLLEPLIFSFYASRLTVCAYMLSVAHVCCL